MTSSEASSADLPAGVVSDVLIVQTEPGASHSVRVAAGLGLQARKLVPLRIGPPGDDGPLRQAAAQLGTYDAIVLGSVRGAEGLANVPRSGSFMGPVYCVGAKTRDRVRSDPHLGAVLGLDLRVPPVARAEGLFEALEADLSPLADRAFLLPKAEQGRTELEQRLRQAGALVDAPVAYRLVSNDLTPRHVDAELSGTRAVAVTSGQLLDQVCRLLSDHQTLDEALGIPLFVIGPIAEEAAERWGWPVAGVAPEADAEALLRMVRDHFASGADGA